MLHSARRARRIRYQRRFPPRQRDLTLRSFNKVLADRGPLPYSRDGSPRSLGTWPTGLKLTRGKRGQRAAAAVVPGRLPRAVLFLIDSDKVPSRGRFDLVRARPRDRGSPTSRLGKLWSSVQPAFRFVAEDDSVLRVTELPIESRTKRAPVRRVNRRARAHVFVNDF